MILIEIYLFNCAASLQQPASKLTSFFQHLAQAVDYVILQLFSILHHGGLNQELVASTFMIAIAPVSVHIVPQPFRPTSRNFPRAKAKPRESPCKHVVTTAALSFS